MKTKILVKHNHINIDKHSPDVVMGQQNPWKILNPISPLGTVHGPNAPTNPEEKPGPSSADRKMPRFPPTASRGSGTQPSGPSIYKRRSLAHLARLLQQSRSLAFPHLLPTFPVDAAPAKLGFRAPLARSAQSAMSKQGASVCSLPYLLLRARVSRDLVAVGRRSARFGSELMGVLGVVVVQEGRPSRWRRPRSTRRSTTRYAAARCHLLPFRSAFGWLPD
jgi:hypothetical protein